MKRFTNILLIATRDNWQETALERAVSLARENQADLTVVDILEPSGDMQVISLDKLKKLTAEIAAKRLAQLDSMVQKHVLDRGTIQTKVIHGTAFLEIIREVLRNDYDLIMKMSGGRKCLKNLLLGSTDMHLLRKCPCPVWIMKPGEPAQYQRILAAVDMEPVSGNQQKTTLNKQILEMASSLALADFSELYIINAWMRNGYTILDGIGSDFDESEVEGWGEKTQQLHRAWLEEQKAQLSDVLGKETMKYLDPQLHLVEGETYEVIIDFVKKKKIDVVVMGTIARTGIPGFFMGNTAESILNNIDCSLLAIKPPGFISPVTLSDRDS